MHVCLNCSISHSVLSSISKSLHFGGRAHIEFHSYLSLHVHTHTRTQTHAHTHTRMHTHAHTHAHTHTHMPHTQYAYVYSTHIYTCMGLYTVCTCTHILRHTHEQTHTHAHKLNFCIMYILLYLLRING